MTELLFLNDAYVSEFDAVVTEITDDGGVVLDRSAFYIGGGGQPCDVGTLTDAASGTEYGVTKVARAGGAIVHSIDGEAKPAVGAALHGSIDWDRRYLLMRTHTALHILCGVVWRDYGALVTGGDMRPGTARMDFELENMSAEFAEEVAARINAEVEEGRDIGVGFMGRHEADAHPDLIRTKINLLPASITEVRTIDIVGLDLQADGGTHVHNTREVGRINVVGHESKGRINKRLRIALADAG
jgi:misacylated tRNA(Ala) deacylase